MITATDVELRAGARLLLSDCTFRVGPEDRIGLVGRNGAGKTTLTKVLAGEAQPAPAQSCAPARSATCRRIPRTGDLDVLGRDRILSARGLDSVAAEIAKLTIQLSETPDDDQVLARYGSLEDRFSASGRLCGRGGCRSYCGESRACPSGRCPALAHAFGWAASPGGARADPVQRSRRGRHVAAGRADEPPRRRLDRLAARLLAHAQRRAGRHLPRRRSA